MTRRLALLRSHHLIRKVQGSHRYILSPKGREIVTALLAARQASIPQLPELAAWKNHAPTCTILRYSIRDEPRQEPA